MIFDGVFQYLSMLNDMFGVWSYYLHTHRCNDFKDKKHNKDCRILYGARLVREGISIAYGGAIQIRSHSIYYNFVRRHSAIKWSLLRRRD